MEYYYFDKNYHRQGPFVEDDFSDESSSVEEKPHMLNRFGTEDVDEDNNHSDMFDDNYGIDMFDDRLDMDDDYESGIPSGLFLKEKTLEDDRYESSKRKIIVLIVVVYIIWCILHQWVQ